MKLQNNISSLAPMGNKAGRSVQKKIEASLKILSVAQKWTWSFV